MGYEVRRGSLGDWVAIYHDGIKLAEGHRLSPEDVLELVGISVGRSYVEQDDCGCCALDGSEAFPEILG